MPDESSILYTLFTATRPVSPVVSARYSRPVARRYPRPLFFSSRDPTGIYGWRAQELSAPSSTFIPAFPATPTLVENCLRGRSDSSIFRATFLNVELWTAVQRGFRSTLKCAKRLLLISKDFRILRFCNFNVSTRGDRFEFVAFSRYCKQCLESVNWILGMFKVFCSDL